MAFFGRQQPTDLTVPTTDVQHPRCARQLGLGERENLLLVFRICAIGEPFDPPVGVLFPEFVIRVGHEPSVRRRSAYGERMKFSVWPNPSRPPQEVLDLAKMADDDGWYGLWCADHYMENTGDTSFAPGDVYECWSLLPAIAAVTSKIRLGPLVAPTSVHHPALLANRAATIDQLSNGRMVLGLGAGWQINEHGAYGIELEPAGARVSRFEESIEIVRSLLDNATTTFDGDYYKFADAPCDPKPVQSPLPILVGTGSPRMLRITATHAQEWNTWGSPDLAGERCAVFNAACESVGTDPGSMFTSVQALVFMTDDSGKVDKIKGGDMGNRSIAGSNDQIIDELGRFADLGFDEVIVPDFTLGSTPEARLDAFRKFNEDIVPALAS